MSFNLVTNLKTCFDFLQGNTLINLIYYSHIPIIIVSLFVGSFVFLKDKKSLLSSILLGISTAFSLWLILDLFLWTSTDSRITVSAWALLEILTALFYILSLYFVYVFIDKKDISFTKKIIFLILILPLIIFSATRFNITEFEASICEAVQSSLVVNYIFFVEALISVWLIILVISRYIKADKLFKNQILILSAGVIFFLLSFFTSDFIATKLENFKLEQGGFFGMVIFLGFLAYVIVKFKAFKIKLLGAQALVGGLVALIAAEFFYVGISNTGLTILISAMIVLTTVMGIFLINSVKNEVKRKDALEIANKEISQRKEELQGMSDQLAKTNDQLRRLDNAKTEFISIASHQLRTPLTAIKGFISLILEGSYGKVPTKQEDVLNKVYSSNERLINLVEDLLNLSRLESGRMEFKLAPTRIEDLCQEAVDTFIIRARYGHLYLQCEKPAAKLPTLTIDGIKVREVISNLVDNALKYTQRGGVTLSLQEFPNPKSQFTNKSQFSNPNNSKGNGGVIRVTISDTGIGVPSTELPYLFSKFSRGKDTNRLNATGTGLGLYVGKQMIEANGGKIWAESDGTNKGSRFIIELPIKQSKEILERWG